MNESNQSDRNEADLVEQARAVIRAGERTHVGVTFLERALKISIVAAMRLTDELVAIGVLGPSGRKGHPVLLDRSTVTPADAADTSGEHTQIVGSAPCGTEAQAIAGSERDGDVEQPQVLIGLRKDRAQCLPVTSLITDVGGQLRAKLNDAKVREYAAAMDLGEAFPPVLVVRDGDGTMCLADGFHRLEAARRLGRQEITAVVRDAERKNLFLYALDANRTHGQPLTQKEKRQAATRLLWDPVWSSWSDQEIGRRCGISGMTVGRLRRALDRSRSNDFWRDRYEIVRAAG